jgi:selenocysteine lyase/cysteine desulfurase
MASIELPLMPRYPATSESAAALHSHLLDARGIEVPISYWQARLWVRISVQIYNTRADYEALRDAVSDLTADNI